MYNNSVDQCLIINDIIIECLELDHSNALSELSASEQQQQCADVTSSGRYEESILMLGIPELPRKDSIDVPIFDRDDQYSNNNDWALSSH